MEANELMIGDWVQYTDIVDEWGYVPQGKVSKLTHHATFDEQKGSRIQIELPDGFQFYNDIEEHFFPIPLTPEIMGKNCTLIEREYQFGEYPNILSIMYDSSARIRIMEGDCEYYGIEIKYVHELQHALRLAGIKKEIVL